MKRLTIIFVVAVVWSLLGVSTVLAAPPSNDDVGSPTVVGALPYSDGPVDTTQATTGATDPGFCLEPSFGPDRATVWYSFTPDASGVHQVDTFGSRYDTTLYVGTPDGSGGIDVIACIDDAGGSLQSAVRWEAIAGTTYLIAVGTCCGGGVVGESGGGGGSLVLNLDVAPPAPTVELTIHPTGGFTPDGAAVISGTIECSPHVVFAFVSVEVSQRAGRFTITGFGGTFLFECASPWTVSVASSDGLFRGGKVDVTAFAFACDGFQCAQDVASRTVRLGGIERPAVSPPVGPPACPGPRPDAGPGPGKPPVSPSMKPPVSPPKKPPVSPPTKPPLSPPMKPPVSPPVGPPGCPPPVSPPATGPVGGGSAIAGALRLEPVLLVGGAMAGALSVAVAAGGVAVAHTRRQRQLVERTYAI